MGQVDPVSTGYEAVRFSRTQGIPSATALGGSVAVGVTTFIAGAQILQQSGADTPLVFFLTALLFLPILFSCAQRSSGAISHGGFYAAARASGSAVRLFFAVWLMLGGYLVLGALLAHGAAVRMDLGFERVFGFKLGTLTVLFVIVAATFLKEIVAKGEGWRSRTTIFWICVSMLLALVIWGFVRRYRAGVTVPKAEPLQHWLLAVSMLASSLWSIDIVLNHRGQFRRPDRTAIWSLITIFCAGNLLNGVIASETLRNPSLMMQNWLNILTWNEARLELLILIVGVLFCVSGLLRVMARITRLLGSMVFAGALPSFEGHGEKAGKTLLYYLALFCAVLVFCAASLSITYLLLISAFAALLSLVLYLQPLLRQNLSRIAPLSLPLHPLLPVLAIVLSIFLMWILPLEDLFIGGLWLIAGAVLYFTVARKKMLPAMQQEQLLAAEGIQPSAPAYRVLACLNDGKINENLLKVGSSLAAAKNGEFLVLRILETSELLPSSVQRTQGKEEWGRMREELQKIPMFGPAAIPVVRMAPDPISGIQATAREFPPDFILVEWPEENSERLRKNRLQSLLHMTSRPLGILKGQLLQEPQRISVACGSSSHTLLALQAGESIASVYDSGFEVLRIFTRSESDDAARDAIRTSIDQSGIRTAMEIFIHEEKDIEQGILRHAAGSDLLLLGVSDDPLTGRPLPDGPSMDIALERTQATLIVKSKEESSRFLMRRFLAQLTTGISALTPKERSELLGQLKVGLQARADFYFMVALAAAIAITGLIMNDGSIVLGAMLVSPLMGPIVGIACGIALGNIDLMRRSGASTFKGMALVLGVGVVMTFVLPSVQPTDQILSRTHPGIFDLLAALAAGAAGAYSLGKKPVAGALPGVAMSLSLEPPLATAGYGLSTSQFWITGGAFLLFLTNLAAIVLSGVGVYLLLGMRPPRKQGMYVVWKAILSVILVTLVLVVPLGLGTYGAIQKGHLKFEVESQFREQALKERFELMDLKISEQENGFLIHPTVLASEEVTPEGIEKFRKVLEQKIGSPIQIDATILQTRRIESPKSEQ